MSGFVTHIPACSHHWAKHTVRDTRTAEQHLRPFPSVQEGKCGRSSNVQEWHLCSRTDKCFQLQHQPRGTGGFYAADSFPHYITQCFSYVTKVSRDFTWNSLSCLQSNAKLGAIHSPVCSTKPTLSALPAFSPRASAHLPICKTHTYYRGEVTPKQPKIIRREEAA